MCRNCPEEEKKTHKVNWLLPILILLVPNLLRIDFKTVNTFPLKSFKHFVCSKICIKYTRFTVSCPWLYAINSRPVLVIWNYESEMNGEIDIRQGYHLLKKSKKAQKHDKMPSVWAQNRDQSEVRLCVGTFVVDVLAHVPRASHHSPDSFYRLLFSYIGPYKYKTSAKCRPS